MNRMSKQKLLFLGCNDDQVPYLEALQKRNYLIVGVDKNKNAPGKKFCEKFYNIGYDELDELLKVGKIEKFTSHDKVFTAGAQFAHKGAAHFSAHFGIPYPAEKAINACLDKVAYYKEFSEIDIPIPKTWFIKNSSELQECLRDVDNDSVFYLKSDFSKNPNYVYRFNKIELSLEKIFWGRDRYLRNHYILQEEFLGANLRINVYGDRFNVFDFNTGDVTHKYTDALSRLEVIEALHRIKKQYDLQNWLIKFDVILSDNSYVVLDIGMDPPFRMVKESVRQQIDFQSHYLDHYLDHIVTYPVSLD
jgi:hypothetical protein